MKRLIIASAFAASMVLGMASAADAKVRVGVFFGYPHYDYQVDRDYRYRAGYGWYQPSYQPAYGYGYNRGRLSCGEAKRQVRISGFRNVSTVECRGRIFTFEATRRGKDITVYVDSRTGRISRG